MSYVVPVRAMAAAWEGRFEEAHRLQSMADPGFFSFDRVLNGALLAFYAVVSGRREAGLEHSARVLKEIEAAEFPYAFGKRQAEISRYLCACVEALAGRLSTATRILQRRTGVDGASAEAMREASTAIWRSIKRPALRDDVHESLEPLRAVGWGGIARVLEQGVTHCLEGEFAGEQQAILTRAELNVLALLAEGRSPKDIAEETGRSIYTIQAHVQNVIKKLGCSGRHEALTVARKKGLLV
jgi:DNA-binding CsgD family transcriptional regulator